MGFTFRGDFAHQDIATLDFRADVDDSGFIQFGQGFFAYVRNIRGNFFRTVFRIACDTGFLFDMNRGKPVVPDNPLGNQDGILEVITVPGHERDQHVLP